MITGIQGSFDNAMLGVLGFNNRKELLDAVPLDNRLPETATDREKLNHAFAVAFGFKNVEDLVEANGMRGKQPSIKA